MICGYHLTHITTNKTYLLGCYLFKVFQVECYRQYFSTLARGVTRYALNTASFSEMPTLIPPLEEQTQIVTYIETESQKIDSKIALIKEEIALLKEYRQALIFEAVTGKIEVGV